MNKVLRIAPLAVVALLLVLALPAFGQDFAPMTTSAPDCDYGGTMQSIEAVDELTVRFTLCVPDPSFPAKVAFSSLGIYPSEYLESTGGGGEALFRNPIGTGPYRLESWDQGNQIILTRNDAYWGEPAREQTIVVRWVSEAAARLVELQAGTADGIDNVGTDDIPNVEADPNLALYPRAGFNIMYLGMSNAVEPFTNLNVRQAVAHAVDKQRIVDNFYPEGSIAANLFIPPDSMSSGYTSEVEPLPFDQAVAQQLLDAAAAEGVTLPIEVTLYFRDVVRGYLPNVSRVAQDMAEQLNSIGGGGYFDVTPQVVESTQFLDEALAGQYALYLLGWTGDWPDATNFFDTHFGPTGEQFGTPIPEVVELLAQAGQLSDPAERNVLYAQVNTLLRDEAPMVPIAHGASAVGFQARIAGAHASPLGNEQFAVMEDPDDDNIVWIQNGEPGGLYCADESDGESLRVCEQITESLMAYETGGSQVVNGLAETYEGNEDATVWTFTLRPGVVFHDGSALDANDVVATYSVQWDAGSPLHVGRTGTFEYWGYMFSGFLNAPES
jgi:ABC-type transport system substrate-binding protein